jgi:amino acid permease
MQNQGESGLDFEMHDIQIDISEVPHETVDISEKSLDLSQKECDNAHSESFTLDNDNNRTNTSETESYHVKRFATIMNCLSSLFGAGILGVPHSMIFCGLIPSLILILIIAILSHIGTLLTFKLAINVNAETFPEIGSKILGKFGSIGIAICTLMYCLSSMIAYLVIGSNAILDWFRMGGIELGDIFWKRAIVVFLYSFLPMGLLMPRNLGFLSLFTTITFGCICFFVVSLIIKTIMLFVREDQHPEITLANLDFNVFSSISIYAFAFALPVVVLPIVRPYNPDPHKRNLISFISMGLCFIVIALTGIFGYLLFGNETEGIVLDSFPQNDILMQIVKGSFFLIVTSAYACHGQNPMGIWSQFFFNDNNPTDLTTRRRMAVFGITVIPPLLLATCLPKAGPALSISGAFGGCIVDFFFPAVMWIKNSGKPYYNYQNILCILLAAFGIITAAIATYISILDAIAAF